MTGSRGYHSYRGKNSKLKIFLAALLILVILAAGIVILLQKHIVYDETGTPRLEIPWQEDVPEDPNAQLDLVIQEPETPAQSEIRAFTVAEAPLSLAAWTSARAQADKSCNAAVVTMKDSGGHVRFDSATAVQWAREIHADTTAALTEMLQGETAVEHAIARLVCFHDPRAANADTEGMGLKNTGGYIFYDGNNSQWIDPGKAAAREYLCQLAAEAAELGFDEILLAGVSYPTEGKLDKIDFGAVAFSADTLEEGKALMLRTFLREMRNALEPYGVALSIEIPAGVIATGRNNAAGLVLTEIAPEVDRIYAATAPEEVAALSAAVTAASETTAFIPVLSTPLAEGGWLLA